MTREIVWETQAKVQNSESENVGRIHIMNGNATQRIFPNLRKCRSSYLKLIEKVYLAYLEKGPRKTRALWGDIIVK
jgi:hypothetical protein